MFTVNGLKFRDKIEWYRAREAHIFVVTGSVHPTEPNFRAHQAAVAFDNLVPLPPEAIE